ncbi:unnamed protein product [Candida verbasci]|uniref:Pre-mRNA-processing factor 39 n=1 Tax=Candida verbasci TaxID=1227364 RepID=A0A9W4TSS5_9ASCO|nr:unnamed protein product [Candida verbasci]
MSNWSKVSIELVQDPNNYKLWFKLIESIEAKNINKSSNEEEIEILRITYDKLLIRYPYLFKYWIKYAEWEFNLGNAEKANEIYQKALFQMSYSIDLWIEFLKFKILTISNNQIEILKLFEKARSLIGYHYFSHEFYQLYLEFLKNYNEESNQFMDKYYILLRIIIEIPLYNYEYFFKIWFDIIKAKPSLISVNESLDSNSLRKLFIDVYITTQFKSYEIYQFEKKINPHNFNFKLISNQQLQNWDAYFEMLNFKHYPSEMLEMNYHRYLYVCLGYPVAWINVADFYIFNHKYNNSRRILKLGYKLIGDYKILLKLIDLEIFLKQYQSAKSLIADFLKFNQNVPVEIYEKLISIERLFKFHDDDYLLNLVDNVIDESKESWFFNILLNFDIKKEKLVKFLDDHKELYQNDKYYKNVTKTLNNKIDKDYEGYDVIINKIKI